MEVNICRPDILIFLLVYFESDVLILPQSRKWKILWKVVLLIFREGEGRYRVLIERKSSFCMTNTMLLLRLTEGGDREGRMEESSHLRQVTSPGTGHQAPAGNSFLLTLSPSALSCYNWRWLSTAKGCLSKYLHATQLSHFPLKVYEEKEDRMSISTLTRHASKWEEIVIYSWLPLIDQTK